VNLKSKSTKESKNSRQQIETSKDRLSKQEKLQERLAKFVGGVAIINVGGYTETEIKEKKDRVEDALHATKAAMEEGIVPGGGAALLYAREAITHPKEDSDAVRIGKQIVYRACGKPFEQILSNAGYTQNDMYPIINEIGVQGEIGTKPWFGFNIKGETIVNMKEAGIIDPAKVTRTALENAASVAGTVLLTECVVVDSPEDKKESNPMAGMGGMF
jgi:chaperonin GroEL